MDLRTFRILAPVARIPMFYVLLVDFSSGGGAVILWRVMMDGGVGGGQAFNCTYVQGFQICT